MIKMNEAAESGRRIQYHRTWRKIMKKENRKKRMLVSILVFFAAAGWICTRAPLSAYAAESVQPRRCIAYPKAGSTFHEESVLPEWHVYFSAGEHVAKLRSSRAGNRMTGSEKKIYDFLAEEIRKIADGQKTSTLFAMPLKDFVNQLQYTQEELGASFESEEEQQNAMGQFIEREVITVEGLRRVYDALLLDFPYELYWYDKAADGSFMVSLDGTQIRDESGRGRCLCVENAVLNFGFTIDAYYGSHYQLYADRMDTARKAAANAQKITEEAAGLSDYQKLAYYCNKICGLVSYNQEAARTRPSGNQNPWQMVYVFDEDRTTNVVCEGYAKAFQYLCDLTAFADDDIYSYIVTGTLLGRTGPSPHMWNVVHMGEYGNYLVDVTNCDEGMIGDNAQLFLAGNTSGNITDGYSFTVSSRRVTYQYDKEMRTMYSDSDLTLVQGPGLKESDVHLHAWAETRRTDAGCTFPGKRVETCSVCGKEREEELPAAGHAYELHAFWSEENKACTVVMACKNDSSHWMAQHAQDAGLEHHDVTLDIKDSQGRLKYKLKMDAQDLTAGNVLTAYRLDSETGKYRMSDGRMRYVTGEDGSIQLSLPENETYQLLNEAAAETASQEILNSVVPKKTQASVKKGQSTMFVFGSGLDMENVKKIVYQSSKKAVAKVSANGKITAKKAGTAVVKAKVTLKNGMVKTVSMKVRVK